MPHLIVGSKVPRDKTDVLISFRVQGNEIAALMSDGSLTVEGDAKAKRVVSDTYLGSDYKPAPAWALPLTEESSRLSRCGQPLLVGL